MWANISDLTSLWPSRWFFHTYKSSFHCSYYYMHFNDLSTSVASGNVKNLAHNSKHLCCCRWALRRYKCFHARKHEIPKWSSFCRSVRTETNRPAHVCLLFEMSPPATTCIHTNFHIYSQTGGWNIMRTVDFSVIYYTRTREWFKNIGLKLKHTD